MLLLKPMRSLVGKLLASPLGKPVYAAYRTWSVLNDRLLNIETGYSASGVGAQMNLPDDRGIDTDQATYRDNVYYEPVNYFNIHRMLRVLAPAGDDVFYDIGCGKGRILCVAARRRLRRVVGIELFEELCADARRNAAALRGKKTPIEVICADAARADYADGTVFAMFNPFGEATMRAVIASIGESMRQRPRDIRIGYYMPKHEQVLAGEPWLEKYASLETMSYTVAFWRSRSVA